MNRRLIVTAIAGTALALFAGASALYLNQKPGRLAAPITTPNVAISPAVTSPAAPVADAAAPTPGAEAVEQATQKAATPEPRWNVYVRRHSPVIGPADARVTIVEFFDPSCEACRAFYPVVHEIMRRHPRDVRLVLRYTPLHEGSDEAVRILETARMQNVFEPVLLSLFEQQPRWADHSGPQLGLAWDAARGAGLDVDKARAAMGQAHIQSAIRQDAADAATLGVAGTPTFFVNQQPLTQFSPQGLYDLVLAEAAKADAAAR